MFGKSAKRSAALKDLAAQLDLEFEENDHYGIFDKICDFELIKKGRKKGITNVIALRDDFKDFDARLFDFSYVISSGKSSRTYSQSVLFVESYRLALPEFWMYPEHIFHRLGNWFGIQDIDFEDFPEFSKSYQLRGEDEYYIRSQMNQQVLRHFTNQKGWHLEGANFFMLFYQHDKLFEPSELTHFLENGKRVFKLFIEKPHNPDV